MDSDHPPAEHAIENYLPLIESLLHEVTRHGRFELGFSIQKGAPLADDLEAPEYVVLKAVRLEEEHLGKITFDCQDWRRLRNEELRLTAQVAAERVIETGDPFTLSPMSPRERRIIHLTLKDRPQVLTKSEGTGAERKVVIIPANPPSHRARR